MQRTDDSHAHVEGETVPSELSEVTRQAETGPEMAVIIDE